MTTGDTPDRRRVAVFECEKRPAKGSRGMVVTNHPLASSAGAEMLLGGGNAIDAAIASLFALTVVEPMMVGILGGGIAHIRLSDGSHLILDGLSTAPGAARPDMYEPLSEGPQSNRATRDRANERGPRSIAVPGALAAWCNALARFGTLSLADVLAPAIRLAEHGFITSPYLSDCIADTAADIRQDTGLSALYLPDGQPLRPGTRLRQGDYAETLRLIARAGVGALYCGPLGQALVDHLMRWDHHLTSEDLLNYRIIDREPIRGSYRGVEIVGPPPPSSAGVHIVQMLNFLEAYNLPELGFGSSDSVHLIAEALKIAFADRAVATADPAFVDVPVERLISKDYAESRRSLLRLDRATDWTPGIPRIESANTTHVTVADSEGNVVSTTQTINSLFGACVQIPGTGAIANNYMYNFDPRPGHALSIAPGKRVFTSMAPMMAVREGGLSFALGLPGGLRIFPSALQAILNVIDHDMTLQEAVEAPRIWTEGDVLEVEPAIPDGVVADLVARGHRVMRVKRIAGGMNGIAIDHDGDLIGAACWRADGTPVAISGGLARPGVRFTLA